MAGHDARKILISGAGIAGLTLGIQLKEAGYEPVIIEREPKLNKDGYMMDFFGTGWDVAERMGLVEELRAIQYPIDELEFVDRNGSAYCSFPVARVTRALDGNYVYLRRPDLQRILFDRAKAQNVEIRFGHSIKSVRNGVDSIDATFDDDTTETFSLVLGADGIHSNVRSLVFGPEDRFTRFLGAYVAAFHLPRGDLLSGNALKLYEETGLVAGIYPLDDAHADATYVMSHAEVDVPRTEQLDFIRGLYKGAGWIAEDLLNAYRSDEPIYFDPVTQIVMDKWHDGRVVLVGDACACLTLLAGQGSHMAMAGAYVLAHELARHGNDHECAFEAYQDFLKPHVDAKQKEAARFSRIFVPRENSWPWLRRLMIRVFTNPLVLPFLFRMLGGRSALANYPG